MLASFVALSLCLSPFPVAAGTDSEHYSKKIGMVALDVVRLNIAGGRFSVKIGLARGFPGADEPFESMVSSIDGVVAAINGAYFDKGSKLPIGDIWTEGRLVRKGLMGTAFCVTSDNQLDIRRVQRHRGVDWSGYQSVLACGPALVLDGKVDCDWESEGFRDPHVTGSASRMGIGYDTNGKLYLVRATTRVTFEEFAIALLQLGCYEAMNLDSGASRGFYFEGKYIEKPGRRLTNILAIVKNGGS